MDHDLQNRIARKLLETLLAYSREFGDTTTTMEHDTLGLTASEFRIVVDRLVVEGLVERAGTDDCTATAKGLTVAANRSLLDSLFPVNGNPDDPLPSELQLFGSRRFTPVPSAPEAWTWRDYERHLQATWTRFLNSQAPDDETAFQQFFERHPVLLPDCYECFGRGASPDRSAYYTQPELPGFRAKRPDFMVVMFDSAAVVVLLIEIEAPGKRWSTDAGVHRPS